MECVSPKGQAAAHDEWLYVPTEFEALYMTCLVENISRKNNLQLLSDSSAAWTGSTFFKYDGEIEDYPTDEQTQQLATLVIRDFIPQNIIDIRPQDLLKFREKYRDERQRFSSAIRDAAMVISECEDETVYNDRLEDLKKEIESSLTDYPGKHGSFEYCWVKPSAASLASLRYYQIQHRNPLIIQGKQRKITNQKG